MEDKVILLTDEQLKQFAHELFQEFAAKLQTREEPKAPKEYVYGLRGICDLFGVSQPTAQKYKNTFLAPAVLQRGRKFMVDKAQALELYQKAMA